MDERQRGLGALVAQVGVVTAELRRGQHALVDEGPRREGGDREVVLRVGSLDDAADDVELALEGVGVGRELRRGADEHLTDEGLYGRSATARN